MLIHEVLFSALTLSAEDGNSITPEKDSSTEIAKVLL